jgi:putative endonuclease
LNRGWQNIISTKEHPKLSLVNFIATILFFEEFQYVNDAIAREKEIKGWSRAKKEALIKTKNPDWIFLNKSACDHWPPKEKPNRF